MAQQFYKRPSYRQDDDSAHGVYDDQAGLKGSVHGQNVSNDAQSSLDDIDKVLNDAENNPGGVSAGAHDSTSTSASSLNSMEGSPLPLNSTFKHKTEDGQTNVPSRIKSILSSKRGKRALIGGGITSILVGGSFGILSLVSGPMQFIHLSQIEMKAHFSHQEDAGDTRLGSIFRFMNTKDVGETRLSWLESKYKNRMLLQFKSAGLEPVFDTKTGYLKGLSVDRTSENSPYKGLSNEETLKQLETRYGTRAYQISDGKFYLPERTFFAQRRALNGLSREIGFSKVTTAARTRVLSKYGMVSWHPLKILDKKINTSIASLIDSYRKKYTEEIKTGSDGATIDTTGASTEDKNGKTTPLDGSKTTATTESTKTTLESIKASNGLKITGGIGALVGIVCTVRTVSDNLGPIRWQQVIMPITRVGMDAITAGQQVADGLDVDPIELSALSQNFVKRDSNGKVISSWDQAAGIQSDVGGKGGVAIDQGTLDMVNNVKPDWIKWADNAAIGTLCSGVGQVITGGVSIVVGVISAGVASTAAQILAASLIGPQVIDHISALVAGDASNALGPGATFGNNVSLGAFFGANAAALPLGGIQLSPSQTAELDQSSNQLDQQAYAQKNVFARIFDPTDYRSLTAHVIDSQALSSPTETVAQFIRVAATLPQQIGSSLASLFMNRTAFAAVGANYGIPEVGISSQDLSNPNTANPRANAEYVATKLLDNNGQNGVPDYIARADTCFGVSITKDSNQKWTVIPTHAVTNLYDGTYPTAECQSANDAQWQKVRMFITDTGVMEGWACTQGDDISCQHNNGIGEDTSATAGGVVAQAGKYTWPLPASVLKGVTITNCWYMPSGGKQGHTGIDMPVPVGTAVLAGNTGTVVQAGPGGDAGNYIMIKHSDGHWTNYQHLSVIEVKVGDTVNAGQEIAKSGDGGYSYSGRPFAHLHFSITTAETLSSRFTGANTVDPLPFLPTVGAPKINCIYP